MNELELRQLNLHAKELGVDRFGRLAEFKAKYKCKTNYDLINELNKHFVSLGEKINEK